jgi:hypothetical protein
METQNLLWGVPAFAQSTEGALLLVIVIIFAVMFRNELRQRMQKVSSAIRTRVFGGVPGGGTTRMCPTNPTHVLDPNWQGCPYCEAEQKSQVQSLGASPPAPTGVNGKGTVVGTTDTRPITGALITYSWRPEGQLFPIRAGKNFVGRGEIGSEAVQRNCDVLVTQDEQMSGEHALILCQQGKHQIIDQMSSNGTFLNGQMLMANQTTELGNYATIQTGRTMWTFIKVDAPQVVEHVAPPLPPKEARKREEDAGRETEVP